jgi:DNA-binding winged helix-turn-helix (wHTH) protein/TolB-like protein/Tfp pilus assembly protein PilF
MLQKTHHLYEFGPFVLDTMQHALLRDGTLVPLTPKTYDTLLVLVRNSGKMLSKEELMNTLWPDRFVEESNLTQQISMIRKALAESPGEHRYIVTIPGRGYRFAAAVRGRYNEEVGTIVGERSPSEVAIEVEDSGKGREEGRQARAAGADSTKITPLRAGSGVGLAIVRKESKVPATAEDVQPLSLAAETARPGMRWPKRTAKPVLVLVGIALGVLLYSVYRKQSIGRLSSQGPRSLAILPFRNLRPGADTDFLGFSLADAVITKLGYVSALAVRPSYAVEKYRNQAIEIPRVAQDLDVDTVLTGNFIRDGDDLRITSQLIDVKTQKILWKGTFDLRYEKLLTVQDTVAQEIIDGLELSLSPAEGERLKPEKPIDPLAYEYYLRGVDLYARSDFPTAIKMLEKSAEIDPNYGLTWAYLGRSYNANASFQFGGREHYRKAQAAFERALLLQPAQIEAHIYMANLLTDTGRVERAVPLLKEGLKTNPNHAEVHWELGYAYRFAGMLKESVSECERARQLDPSVKLNSSALNSYLYLGQYDKFLQSLPKTNDVAFVAFYRGFGEYHKKDWEQAAKDFDRAFELDPSILHAQVGRALSDAIGHENPKGLEILHQTEDKIQERGVRDPEAIYKIAQAYAQLGDEASALRVLRYSIENGFFSFPYLATDPLLERLRNEAEFARLMEVARQRHVAFKTRFF